jgi:hypothetical protein
MIPLPSPNFHSEPLLVRPKGIQPGPEMETLIALVAARAAEL